MPALSVGDRWPRRFPPGKGYPLSWVTSVETSLLWVWTAMRALYLRTSPLRVAVSLTTGRTGDSKFSRSVCRIPRSQGPSWPGAACKPHFCLSFGCTGHVGHLKVHPPSVRGACVESSRSRMPRRRCAGRCKRFVPKVGTRSFITFTEAACVSASL